MTRSLTQLFLAPLTVLVLASFAMVPAADARGGGGRGGGGFHGGGDFGGGGRQIDNSHRDVRADNVRSTSVNHVNNVDVNRNVNVNVDRGGCCGGWDNDYHPVATAAAIGVTAAVVGSMVRSIPANCVPVNYGGWIYQQCGSTWYQPQGSQYVVINPPY